MRVVVSVFFFAASALLLACGTDTSQFVKGQTYPLDIFTAERHTTQSDIRIDTSIAFNNCNPIIH